MCNSKLASMATSCFTVKIDGCKTFAHLIEKDLSIFDSGLLVQLGFLILCFRCDRLSVCLPKSQLAALFDHRAWSDLK